MRDMITREGRSIRNIPIPGSTKQQAGYPPQYSDKTDTPDMHPARPRLPKRRGNGLWLLATGVVLASATVGLLLSTIFEKATVTLTPKMVSITTPLSLTASPNAPASALAYQTITATQTASTSVTANSTQHVSRSATGVITLYNTFSAAPQSLAAGTRLTTSDGKIYKIGSAVVVPGIIKKPDGTLSPGSVTATITADKPGAAYNQPTSVPLTIPGFKGTPKYTKFAAQTQGAVSGGMTGDEPAIAPADMAAAQNSLKRQIDGGIRSLATAQVPSGFIEVTGSLAVSYANISQTAGQANTMLLSQSATASVAIVRVSDLTLALAKTLPEYVNEPVVFKDLSQVAVGLAVGSSPNPVGPLNLSITGSPRLVWQIDQDAIKKALTGQAKSSFEETIKKYQPSVAKAQATIRPFWKTTFPSNPDKLVISIEQRP